LPKIISNFKDLKFDIILGIPPYQKENKKGARARGGNSNLYLEFITRSFEILAVDGYLEFITPKNWRKIGSTVLKEFTSRRIIYFTQL